jgi:hypothetical protein
MRRFRLSTLLLLIVIAALSIALVVQQRRAARREAELQILLKSQITDSAMLNDLIMERSNATAERGSVVTR